MQSLWNIYHSDMPAFIREIADTPVMLRLKDVGMHCGCEYTRIPQYIGVKPYSRWIHSVGVALIVWHFTQDIAQSVAGLLHDIASPAFAHAIDFLRGDHIRQEATEKDTEAIIRNSPELMALLRKYNLAVDEVSDYHIYPIADNDSPRLSADRLEYTLGNALNHHLADLAEIRNLFCDLTVAENEDHIPEIQFRTRACAERFGDISLTNSRVYSCDEARYVMQTLADLLRDAIHKDILHESDLYATESGVIQILQSDADFNTLWLDYRTLSGVLRSGKHPDDGRHWINLDAKRRCIDPIVDGCNRLTSLSPEYAEALRAYKTESYDYWLCAK